MSSTIVANEIRKASLKTRERRKPESRIDREIERFVITSSRGVHKRARTRDEFSGFEAI